MSVGGSSMDETFFFLFNQNLYNIYSDDEKVINKYYYFFLLFKNEHIYISVNMKFGSRLGAQRNGFILITIYNNYTIVTRF